MSGDWERAFRERARAAQRGPESLMLSVQDVSILAADVERCLYFWTLPGPATARITRAARRLRGVRLSPAEVREITVSAP